ncbi:MAG: RsiV family protein [Desulfovibrionaceae bacterium]|nr:RsiV family protein [Desulfovibrionaceae bacterium]
MRRRNVCPLLFCLLPAFAVLFACEALASAGSSLVAVNEVPGPVRELEPAGTLGSRPYYTVNLKKTGRKGLPDIQFTYPSVGVTSVDRDIALWAQHIASSFERDFASQAFAAESSQPAWDPKSASSFLSASYTMLSASDDVVSIVFSLWMGTTHESFIGSIDGHPYMEQSYSEDVLTLNYNLRTGQRLHLVDMFEKVDVALDILSSQSRQALAKSVGRGHVDAVILKGTTPEPENYASLALTRDGIRVYFQPYQVSSLAGSQYVNIALEALLDAGPMLSLWGR